MKFWEIPLTLKEWPKQVKYLPHSNVGRAFLFEDGDVVCTYTDGEHEDSSVSFVFFSSTSMTPSLPFGPDRFRYPTLGAVSGFDVTSDLNNAEVWAYGWLKWDGCCNFAYPGDGDDHVCGIEGFEARFFNWQKVYAVCGLAMGSYPATGDLDFSLKGHFEFEGTHGA